MKKILTILSATALITTTASSVISCDTTEQNEKDSFLDKDDWNTINQILKENVFNVNKNETNRFILNDSYDNFLNALVIPSFEKELKEKKFKELEIKSKISLLKEEKLYIICFNEDKTTGSSSEYFFLNKD